MSTEKNKKIKKVIIFGRTNVGKSTLFNCLTEKRTAIVSDKEGTTRDANIGIVNWQGKNFQLIDTGGIIDTKQLTLTKKEIKNQNKQNDINKNVQQQARDYLKQADLIIFLTDARSGLMPDDKKMILELKKNLPTMDNVLLVINKADNPRLIRDTAEFNKLALNEPIAISATTGSGTGDLLDIIIHRLHLKKTANQKLKDKNLINVCLIGKPNVGKSSLINKIIDLYGEQNQLLNKMIVSPIPHTTREPKDIEITINENTIKFIDTAGISKQGQKKAKKEKRSKAIEKFSIDKSLGALKKSDIALMLIDIKEGLTQQEAKIVEEIIERQISLIIIANKWDLIEEKDVKYFTQEIYRRLPFVQWAPILFTSAQTGEKVQRIIEKILEISEVRKTEINENYLSKFLQKIIKKHLPVKGGGFKHPYIYKLKQIHVNPPRFSVVIGSEDILDKTYIRYIENQIRENFKIIGTPIKIEVVNKRKIHSKRDEEIAE